MNLEIVQAWTFHFSDEDCFYFMKDFCSTLYFVNTVFFPLPLFFFHYLSSSSPSFFLFPWWKLSEASPSATVFIYTRLCPLLKAFLCFSTLWALSCLVSLLVILLALTDSQVKCFLRAQCICVFVTPALPFHPSVMCSNFLCLLWAFLEHRALRSKRNLRLSYAYSLKHVKLS